MNNKHCLILFILLLHCIPTLAQALRGTVYDATSKKPVPDALVYLDGTSIHTITDQMGRFELQIPGVINTSLIVNHLSYVSFVVPNPFSEMPENIYLQGRDYQLTETIVTTDRFTRAQRIKAFKEQFLGNSKAGASCEILNEDEITVLYDLDTQTLTAFSDKPIIVVNHFLGYRILFTLVEFKAVFAGGKIERDYTRYQFFAVTSSYTDLYPDNKTLQKRRNEAYEHSITYFYKNLTHHTLAKASYKLFHRQDPLDPYDVFEVQDSLSQKHIHIKPSMNVEKIMSGVRTVSATGGNLNLSRPIGEQIPYRTIDVLYKRNIQSGIIFYTDEFFSDEYGNINAIDKIVYTGHFGQLGAGDMLPLNYQPQTP